MRRIKKGFFTGDGNAYYQPLYSNNVFIGAIRFYASTQKSSTNNLKTGQKNISASFPAYFQEKIAMLAHPIALTFFHFRLFELAMTDGLTTLYSKRQFESDIQNVFDKIKSANTRHQETMPCLVLLDLDHFKNLNDQLGHVVGDFALKSFASFFKKELPANMPLYRVGGEEFALIFTETSPKEIFEILDQIRHTLKTQKFSMTLDNDEKNFTLSFSSGIGPLRSDTLNTHSWVDLADQALYQAKKQGRDRIIVYGEKSLPNIEFFDESAIDVSSSEGFHDGVIPAL